VGRFSKNVFKLTLNYLPPYGFPSGWGEGNEKSHFQEINRTQQRSIFRAEASVVTGDSKNGPDNSQIPNKREPEELLGPSNLGGSNRRQLPIFGWAGAGETGGGGKLESY